MIYTYDHDHGYYIIQRSACAAACTYTCVRIRSYNYTCIFFVFFLHACTFCTAGMHSCNARACVQFMVTIIFIIYNDEQAPREQRLGLHVYALVLELDRSMYIDIDRYRARSLDRSIASSCM